MPSPWDLGEYLYSVERFRSIFFFCPDVVSSFVFCTERRSNLIYSCVPPLRNRLSLSPRAAAAGPPARWFWPAYGTYMAVACGLGHMSYKRPACDIFIAGITQFPTTAYCVVALAGSRRWPSATCGGGDNPPAASSSPIDMVRLPYRVMYYAGFIGNSPLLPMYPLLVQYSGMSLGAINTLLHACESLTIHIDTSLASGENICFFVIVPCQIGSSHPPRPPRSSKHDMFRKFSRVDDHVGYAGDQSLTSNQSDRFTRVESLETVLIRDDVRYIWNKLKMIWIHHEQE